MKHSKKDDELTPELKETLRKLMEVPDDAKEWDFFGDISDNIPPPKYFTQGKPEPGYKWAAYAIVAAVAGAIGWMIGRG